MKLHLTALAASALTLALLTTNSGAQETGLPQTPFYDTSSAWDWSGLYVGGHAGIVDSGRLPGLWSDTRGLEGGAQAGVTAQFGMFTLGGETSLTYSPGLTNHVGNGVQLKQDWSGSAKVLAGIAVDRFHAYGSLGYGVARLQQNGSPTHSAIFAGGVQFGGGLEYALTEEMTARLDYTQTHTNNIRLDQGSYNMVTHAVRAGLNFRF